MDKKRYQFRAVYFENKTDGETECSSVSLKKAKTGYDTVGLYEISENKDNIEENHIADMPREDFQLIQDSKFPNGFESWQRTHYEIVRALNENQEGLNGSFYLKDMYQASGEDVRIAIAKEMTNKFEVFQSKASVPEEKFGNQVKRFISSEKLKVEDIFFSVMKALGKSS